MKRLLFFSSILLVTTMAMTFQIPFGQPPCLAGKMPRMILAVSHRTSLLRFNSYLPTKGEMPLIIAQAKGSCGCTGVDYTKEPVLPGKSGIIKATYNAATLGSFNKTVTVESNAEGGHGCLIVQRRSYSRVMFLQK